MGTPLYRLDEPPARPQGAGHCGLWFDRFFNCYESDWSLTATAKKDWIESVARKVGDQAQIAAALLRQDRLCTALQGEIRFYAVTWHFATGQGNPHPVENGFHWHQVLGTPYIAGAAVKGLVRNWVEIWMPFESEQERLDTLFRWFGSAGKDFKRRKALRDKGYRPPTPDTSTDTQAGSFIFFDALPIEPVMLKCDVMTPHMGRWYEQGGALEEDATPANLAECLPADWHDPVPIPFLVADRPKFQFAIAPRHGTAKSELVAILAALDEALKWLGAGAKTAVGYGRMEPDRVEESRRHEARRRQEARAGMTPLEIMIDDFLSQRPDKNQAEISAVIGALKQNHWQGTDRQQVAVWLEQQMRAKKHWRPTSSAKRPEKDTDHQNTLRVLDWQKG